MLVGQVGDFAAARGALDESLLDEERLIDLFHSAGVLADGGGDGVDTHGSALELVDDGQQNLAVDEVEAVTVYVQGFEGKARDFQVDAPASLDLRKVADAAQQRVGDTWRAAAAACNLGGSFHIDGLLEDAGRAEDDATECVGIIIFKMQVNAEAGTQGGCQQTAARGGPHQCKGVEVYLYAACAGAAVNHDVDAIVLHRRVKILLHHG